MSQRIIIVQPNGKRDAGLTERDVDLFNPKTTVSQVQTIAAEHPMQRSDEQTRELVDVFIGNLPEPQRTMFVRHYRDEEPFQKIAESMGLERKVVLKSLAKIYAKLRFVLMPEETAS